VGGISGADLKQKLSQLPTVRKTVVVDEDKFRVQARVFPQTSAVDGELARSVGELAIREKFQIEELHTEEGRLDEVFRTITLPETVKEASK